MKKLMGRPENVERNKLLIKLYNEGKKQIELAKIFGVGRSTVSDLIKDYGKKYGKLTK